MFSSTIRLGPDQVRPPSVEVVDASCVGPARPAVPSAGFSSNVRCATYTLPSGPNETQGSLPRSRVPPVHFVRPGNVAVANVSPPSWLTPARLPNAPPSTG